MSWCFSEDMDPEREVVRQLGELSVERLKLVHTELKLPAITNDAKKESDSYIRKMILRHLSSEAIVDAEDEGLSTFLHLNTFINTLTAEDPKESTDETQESDSKDEVKSGVSLPDSKDGVTIVDSDKKTCKKSAENAEKQTDVLKFQKQQEDLLKSSFWKKDLKIKGQIGGPGEKGKLNFISVVRKIERAVKQGYRETEICEAVIEMVSPEQRLRSLLEGKFDLTLPKLRRILRCHFKEEEASELYTQLTNLSQEEGAGADEFVNDVIILRDKILFTSKEAESEFNYPETIVQKQYIHAILTGLRDNNIKSEVKAALSSGGEMDDLELMEVVNKSMKEEDERKRKLKASKKAAKVNAVSEKEDPGNRKHQSKEGKENPIVAELREIRAGLSEISNLKTDVEVLKVNAMSEREDSTRKRQAKENENPIVAELKEIRAGLNEISSLKNDVEVLKECVRNIGSGNPNGFQGGRKMVYGCKNCKDQNIRGCQHCFKCGESGHKKENCPN